LKQRLNTHSRSTFCTAFATGSLETVNTPTIIFNVFVNIALCSFFTVISFYMARPPRFLSSRAPRFLRQINKQETISICFCGPAKTQALGIPLIAAMYSTSDDMTRALIQIPMILYTAEQIFVGQVLVWLFKRWLKKDAEEKLLQESQPETRESVGTLDTETETEKNIAPAV
jgi:sodium/bile acid cotransporter 7